jgi:hypothetical protein
MPILFVVWLILALVVGFFGRRLRFGFWGYFFASILFTPIIGFLMLVAAVPTRPQRQALKRGMRTHTNVDHK